MNSIWIHCFDFGDYFKFTNLFILFLSFLKYVFALYIADLLSSHFFISLFFLLFSWKFVVCPPTSDLVFHSISLAYLFWIKKFIFLILILEFFFLLLPYFSFLSFNLSLLDFTEALAFLWYLFSPSLEAI